jgi:hypothetical protein
VFAQRLLPAARGGGGFTPPDAEDYDMTDDEVAWWQEQAALLDPDAYVFTFQDAHSEAVTAGETWYLVNGWHMDGGSGAFWHHRPADVNRALALSAGTTIATGTAPSSNVAFKYVCKPSLVIAGDSRYTTDPRGLYFDRIRKLQRELTQYKVNATRVDNTVTTTAFPTDFTDGMIIHASWHDIAWTTLYESGSSTPVINLHNEISDEHGLRWAEPLLMPFKRTTFPGIAVRGITGPPDTSRGQVIFCKLPEDGSW